MARITKNDIYQKHGIIYKNGKILTPFGTWVNPLMPKGTNSKIGNAHTWAMYHGNEEHTVKEFGELTKAVMESAKVTSFCGSCSCHCDGCYCDAGRYIFDNVKSANVRKLLLAKMYLEWLERALNAQIEADKITQIRIHSSGDFFSIAYCHMWLRIAKANPNVRFWTYTKYDYALDVFENVGNVSIVPSITPCGINFGTCAELLEMYKELTENGFRVHICGCGTDYQKHCAECSHGCKAVGTECDYVLFIKHSTPDYKAGKNDIEDFKAVVEIVKAQEN